LGEAQRKKAVELFGNEAVGGQWATFLGEVRMTATIPFRPDNSWPVNRRVSNAWPG
jgi:hypothetical protein